MRAQESESGSTTDETELDQLLQNILEETEEALSTYHKETKEKQDKELLDRRGRGSLPETIGISGTNAKAACGRKR